MPCPHSQKTLLGNLLITSERLAIVEMPIARSFRSSIFRASLDEGSEAPRAVAVKHFIQLRYQSTEGHVKKDLVSSVENLIHPPVLTRAAPPANSRLLSANSGLLPASFRSAQGPGRFEASQRARTSRLLSNPRWQYPTNLTLFDPRQHPAISRPSTSGNSSATRVCECISSNPAQQNSHAAAKGSRSDRRIGLSS